MMQLTDQFRGHITHLFEGLQGTRYEDLAKSAWQKAKGSTTPTEVLQIFRELGNKFASIGEGGYRRLGIQLHTLIEEEEKRIQCIASPVLGAPSNLEDERIQAPPRKRRRAEEPVETKPMEEQTEKPVESAPMEVEKQAAHPPPQQPPGLVNLIPIILPYVPKEGRAQLLGTSKELVDFVFHSEVEPYLANLTSLLSDSEFPNLFNLVTGETLPSADLFKQRAEAEKRGDAVTVTKIIYELSSAYLKVQDLASEWKSLPQTVKELFGNMEDSKILSNVEYCKQVLRASRAYNLRCIARMRDAPKRRFTTQAEYIEAGEQEAKKLLQEKDKIEELSNAHLVGLGLKLTRLPVEVTHLKLKRLYLSCSEGIRLPRQIKNLSLLESLDLSKTNLSKIPEVLYTFTKLKYLELSDNHITQLPSQLWNTLKNLERLYVGRNEIDTISPGIEELKYLKILNLEKNNIAQLPTEIGSLSNLESLFISHNRLTSLPSQIGQLSKLQELYASSNELRTITPEILNLRYLVTLDLGSNLIEEVPREIGNLKSLIVFGISRNQIRSLPTELASIATLRRLWIAHNFLTSLPKEIIEKPDLNIDDRDLTKQKPLPRV